jgi:hypothetical protein
VPQTGLDLRAGVTAAAPGQLHRGERQRSGQEDQANTERMFVHRLDFPAVQKDHKRRWLREMGGLSLADAFSLCELLANTESRATILRASEVIETRVASAP